MHTIVSEKLLDLSLRGHLERIREHLRQVFIAAPAEVALANPNEEKGGDEKWNAVKPSGKTAC